MIEESGLVALRIATAPVADAAVSEAAAAFAVQFGALDREGAQASIMAGLDHESPSVRALAAILSPFAFGRADFPAVLSVFADGLPTRPDRLALLPLIEPHLLPLFAIDLELAAYGPSALCAKLVAQCRTDEPTGRGTAAIALGLLADDEAAAGIFLADMLESDPSTYAVASAIWGYFHTSPPADRAAAVLRRVAYTDPVASLRATAYQLLGMIGSDVSGAFIDVDTPPALGALGGRTIAGGGLLSDDELRRMRTRLRRGTGDANQLATVLALLTGADEGIIPDVTEWASSLTPADAATVRHQLMPYVSVITIDTTRLVDALELRAEAEA